MVWESEEVKKHGEDVCTMLDMEGMWNGLAVCVNVRGIKRFPTLWARKSFRREL